jgi:hypothetical protein
VWHSRSPDLNSCDFYLWKKIKNKVYSNNPHSLDELKHIICEKNTSVEGNEITILSNHLFKRWKFV